MNLIKKYGTLIGFLGIIIFFTINLPNTFLTANNLINISQQISMLAVVAFTMTIVMVMNDFDLSVYFFVVFVIVFDLLLAVRYLQALEM